MECSIIGATYKGRSVGLDGQECMNLFPEASASAEAKNVAALIGTPGLRLLTEIGGNQGCRGMYSSARDRLLVIVGDLLYEINSDYTSVIRGTLKTSEGAVAFAEIDKQIDPTAAAISHIAMVDGVHGYIFNTATNEFTQITGDYLPGTSIISQNGFFIQNVVDSNKFIYSNLYDGLTWEASLNFFAAETSPDPIIHISLINDQLWLFGSKTVEIWSFTGSADQLWVRSGVGYINTGMAGKYAVTEINGHVYWLGSTQGQHMIWHSGQSYSPDRVSTHAIEYIIGQMDDVSDCVGFSYEQEGHQFVIFNFSRGNRTLVYDVTTGMWHERGSLNVSTGLNDRHRAMFVTMWRGKVIVGDDVNSNLYEWSLDQYTDNGRLIKRVRTAPHIHNERHRVFFHQLEIDIERGVGLNANDPNSPEKYGSDPKIMLRFSNDGGYTYSSQELWRTIGKMGQRLTRCRFNKLGMSRDRVFQLTMTDPVKWILIDARCDLSAEQP